MKKSVLFIITTAFTGLLCLTSCQSQEEKVINKLNNLSERIEKNCDSYNADDWEKVVEEWSAIHESLADCDFTTEQLKEISIAEGKLSSIILSKGAKAAGNGIINAISNFGSFANGLKEGLENIDNEKELEEIGEGIEDEINKAVQSLEDALGE